MLLTTHTTRRCPTVVGHWAIVGLPRPRLRPRNCALGKVLTGVLTEALTEVPPEVIVEAPIGALIEVPNDAFSIVRSKALAA